MHDDGAGPGGTWRSARRVHVALLAGLLVLPLLVLPTAPAEAARFDDVPTADTFVVDIDRLAAAGVTRGCDPPDNTRFCPDDAVTREQMAAFLNRPLDLPAARERFRDVTSGNIFATDIGALAAAGITKGCNPPANDRFCPGLTVTRAQMAAFLRRALDLPSAQEQFRDVTSGNVFAADIGALAAAGITKGCNPPTNNRFCPDDVVTRGQLAAFLVRGGLAPHPADDVPGLRRGATPSSRDASPDAPSLTDAYPDGDSLRAALPRDPDDPEPLGFSGVVGNPDTITTGDPSTLVCLEYDGRGDAVFLSDNGTFLRESGGAYLFTSRYDDGTSVRLAADGEFGSRSAARAEVQRYARPLGQLPTLLRREVGSLGVRRGSDNPRGAPGFGIGVTTGDMDRRQDARQLEEILFHEAIHTGFGEDLSRQRSRRWLRAQVDDGRWITPYARENPDQEDVAESAVFAYALLHDRDRLPDDLEAAVLERIPNRTATIATLLPPDQPIFTRRDANPTCG